MIGCRLSISTIRTEDGMDCTRGLLHGVLKTALFVDMYH
jgi:hypothetical protein